MPWETAFEPDPVVEAYKRHVDRILLRQNLRRAVTERVANLIALPRLAAEARRTSRRSSGSSATQASRRDRRRSRGDHSRVGAPHVDFVYARNRTNVERLVAVLRPHAPYPRGAPPGLAVRVERGHRRAGAQLSP